LSCTKGVEKFDHPLSDGSSVTLVDTPGFNDYSDEGYKSDEEILRMIAAFLKTQ
jgi:peptide subunit release factor RF-3